MQCSLNNAEELWEGVFTFFCFTFFSETKMKNKINISFKNSCNT